MGVSAWARRLAGQKTASAWARRLTDDAKTPDKTPPKTPDKTAGKGKRGKAG